MARSNETLLKEGANCTQRAAHEAAALTAATEGEAQVLFKEAAPQLIAWRLALQTALCAVTELERRALGGQPVQEDRAQ